jgi:hypothetical protein
MEGLRTPEGEAIDVQQAFASAMVEQANTANEEPLHEPPPKKDPSPPARKRRTGRPSKADQPRVTNKVGSVSSKPKDYTQQLTGIVQLSWGVLAATNPADAAAVKMHGPGIVQSVNQLAQENSTVAKGIEFLTTGSAIGAVVFAVMPLVAQIAANHGRVNPDRLTALGVQDPEKLAEVTRNDVHAMQEAALREAS